MFSKISIIFITTLVFSTAVAAGGPIRPGLGSSGPIANSCDTGPVQCCNELYQSNSEKATWIRDNIGVKIPIDGMVGMNCSPVSLVGVGGGTKCQQQPVCCKDNHFKGVVAIGCSPVNVNV